MGVAPEAVGRGYDRDQSAGYLVTLASRLFAAQLRDLCARAFIEQPSAAEMLSRMERMGLVTRTRDPDDGRRFRYHLTAWTRDRVDALKADAAAGNRAALAGIPEDRIETFLSVLHQVIDNLAPEDRASAPSRTGRRAAA